MLRKALLIAGLVSLVGCVTAKTTSIGYDVGTCVLQPQEATPEGNSFAVAKIIGEYNDQIVIKLLVPTEGFSPVMPFPREAFENVTQVECPLE